MIPKFLKRIRGGEFSSRRKRQRGYRRCPFDLHWSALRGRGVGREVRLNMENASFLATSEEVEAIEQRAIFVLAFLDEAGEAQITITGRLRKRERLEGGEVRVTIDYLEPTLLANQLDEEHWPYFNRRKSYRVEPMNAEGTRATVLLRWRRYKIEFVLHDISEGGLAIRVANHSDVKLPRDGRVRAELELPGTGGVIPMALRRMHVVETAACSRVGFRIDRVGTLDYQEVMRRMGRAIREQHHLRREAMDKRTAERRKREEAA